MTDILSYISNIVWGPPLLVLLVGTGIFLSIRLSFIQIKGLLHSLYLALVKRREAGDEASGDISHFQALLTALAATVGTGNIAGVATAIAAGGPGALFWMWMTGLFGMATKFSEAVLAVKYRVANARGEMSGGPMYYLSRGLNLHWLGAVFAVFAAVAAFGIGNMVQSNSVADALNATFHIPKAATGVLLTVFTGIVLIGGIKSIGRVTQVLVPVMIVFYVLAALTIIILNLSAVPTIFLLVVKKAFSPMAAAGGFAGALVKDAVRFGVARGVFSNESGLGSSPIAAAAARTKTPTAQALVSMTQTFIDTIVVCSMTGFVIAWGGMVVTLGLALFAYSTLLGWSYYGEKSVEFLFGARAAYPYRLIFTLFIFIGAVARLEVVWSFSDIMNGLMAVPNLVGLLLLSGVVVKETRAYWKNKALTRLSAGSE
jgi:AGCS family alanine or glycine:cation symporter